MPNYDTPEAKRRFYEEQDRTGWIVFGGNPPSDAAQILGRPPKRGGPPGSIAELDRRSRKSDKELSPEEFRKLREAEYLGLFGDLPGNYNSLSPEQIQAKINNEKNRRRRAGGGSSSPGTGPGGSGSQRLTREQWKELYSDPNRQLTADEYSTFLAQGAADEERRRQASLDSLDEDFRRREFTQQGLRDQLAYIQQLTGSAGSVFAGGLLRSAPGSRHQLPSDLGALYRGHDVPPGPAPLPGGPLFVNNDPVALASAYQRIVRRTPTSTLNSLPPSSLSRLSTLGILAGQSPGEFLELVQQSRPSRGFLYPGAGARL